MKNPAVLRYDLALLRVNMDYTWTFEGGGEGGEGEGCTGAVPHVPAQFGDTGVATQSQASQKPLRQLDAVM